MEDVLEVQQQNAYPALRERVQSTLIDSILIVVLMFVFSSGLENQENVPDALRIALFVGIWVVYEPLCISLGCTLGNYIMNIRVRKHDDPTKRINFFRALLRYIVKLPLGWISFLTIHTNKEKRALHDLAAGSVMIRK